MPKTTNEQWEYLFEIIQKSETKFPQTRLQVLAFGARIGLEERQKLFQIRDQQTTITWPLAMQIHNILPTADPYRLMRLKRPPMTGTLAGAWTYHILSSYRNGFWEDADIWLGGHEEYLFSKNNTVEIATQYDNSIQTYSFDRKTRYLQIGDRRYYVAKLTDKQLEIIWGNGESVSKLQFDRLPDGKLHIIQKQSEEVSCDYLPSGYWRIEKEYSRETENENWALENDYTRKIGFWVWDFRLNARNIVEYKFGQRSCFQSAKPVTSHIIYFFFNQKRYFNGQIMFDGKNNFWLYVLTDQTGTPENSLKMYRFTRWDSSSLQGLGRNIWWAETYPIYAMNTDKFPLEHLELWHNTPSDAASLFDTMDFIERPSEYADEKYAGAYVFAHAFKQNIKMRATVNAGLLYRQFLAILDMWLQLRSKAVTIRNIRLFTFKKYPEYINKLQTEIERMKQE